MESKKLVSVRINEDDLGRLEGICQNGGYWNRSDLIQLGVKAIIQLHDNGLLNKVAMFRPQYGDVIDEIKFNYHRQVK
jgi:metal-responsive CopG/Arc/MetJ family transcriptional regulator